MNTYKYVTWPANVVLDQFVANTMDEADAMFLDKHKFSYVKKGIQVQAIIRPDMTPSEWFVKCISDLVEGTV